MKRILLFLIISTFFLENADAQKKNNFEMGLYVGVPIASKNGVFANSEWADEYAKKYNFNFGVNFAYYFGIMDNLKVGMLIGYDHFIMDYNEDGTGIAYDESISYIDIDAESESYVPIAVSAKYFFAESFFAGLDLGYAHDISGDNSNGTGGLYYRPRISWSTRVVDLYAYYKGLSFNKNEAVTPHIGSAGIGLTFKF